MGRVLTFADAEIIRLTKEQFVPVTGDDWYQRRRQDAEGEFFRKVADQGPRKGKDGSTRQGIYVCTASGRMLAYRNHQDAAVMRGVLKQALVAQLIERISGIRYHPSSVWRLLRAMGWSLRTPGEPAPQSNAYVARHWTAPSPSGDRQARGDGK